MKEVKKDFISSLIFFLIGIGTLLSSLTIKDPGISEMGPRRFPEFIGICIIVLSVTLLTKTLYLSRKQNVAKTEKSYSPQGMRECRNNEFRALGLAGICFLYAITFTIWGYFASTFLVITAIGLLFREKRIWVYSLLYGVAVLIWAGFTYLLAIRLP